MNNTFQACEYSRYELGSSMFGVTAPASAVSHASHLAPTSALRLLWSQRILDIYIFKKARLFGHTPQIGIVSGVRGDRWFLRGSRRWSCIFICIPFTVGCRH
jgi:hypothetical protein